MTLSLGANYSKVHKWMRVLDEKLPTGTMKSKEVTDIMQDAVKPLKLTDMSILQTQCCQTYFILSSRAVRENYLGIRPQTVIRGIKIYLSTLGVAHIRNCNWPITAW